MRLLAAVAIVVAMVMVVLSVEHDRRCGVVPMPVPFTDANSNATNPDLDAFGDDHWFGARVRRTGECRHRQERNKKKGEQSILHGTLSRLGTLRPDTGQNARPVPLQSV